jgi:hypothetical protein
MGGFLKGRRSLFSLMKLVTACVFMAEWVRSLVVGDEIRVSLFGNSQVLKS